MPSILISTSLSLDHWRPILSPVPLAADAPGEAPFLVLSDSGGDWRTKHPAWGLTGVLIGTISLVSAPRTPPFDPETLTLELSREATPSELRLACHTMFEIVRLRRELDQLSAAKARLTEEALHDPLTGLANRRAWDHELARLSARKGPAVSLAMAVFDLDHFKQVNDTAGHLRGDEVLTSVARLLCGALRQSDFLARVGGDEFGLLLPGVPQAAAGEVIERARAAVAPSGVTASAGWSWSPAASSPGPVEQWAAADRALQQAKQAGGNASVQAM